jgi:hypothetical protein
LTTFWYSSLIFWTKILLYFGCTIREGFHNVVQLPPIPMMSLKWGAGTDLVMMRGLHDVLADTRKNVPSVIHMDRQRYLKRMQMQRGPQHHSQLAPKSGEKGWVFNGNGLVCWNTWNGNGDVLVPCPVSKEERGDGLNLEGLRARVRAHVRAGVARSSELKIPHWTYQMGVRVRFVVCWDI